MNTISTSAPPVPTREVSAGLKQQFQDFKALRKALKSGDVDAAQKAYDALQKDIQANAKAGGKNPFDPNTQAGKDLAAIGTALQAKDLDAAKSAFRALHQDLRPPQGGVEHGGRAHGRHHPDNDGDADDQNGGSTGTAQNSTTSFTRIQITLDVHA